MYSSRELDEPTLTAIDAARSSGDTLTDALWDGMRSQAAAQLDQLTPDDRQAAATLAAKGMIESVGMVEGIRSQLSAFDLLWMFLAVGTAYRMMAASRLQDSPELEGASA